VEEKKNLHDVEEGGKEADKEEIKTVMKISIPREMEKL
jgi:hypothetical protein